MRVAVDARTAYAPQRRGIGNNVVDLYRHLARRRPDWTFVMLHQTAADDPFAGCANVVPQRIDIPGDRFDLWESVRLPWAARAAGADVLHSPANTAPALRLVPSVVTVHDLIPMQSAPGNAAAQRWARRVRRSARGARQVITPSRYTRSLVVGLLQVPEDQVTVAHWGPAERYRHAPGQDAIARVREKYGLAASGDYVFAFGAPDARKNTSRIIAAWAHLSPQLQQHYPLLIVGLDPAAQTVFASEAARYHPAGQCVIHGFADEADVPLLLKGATVFCYPSLSEGFGLPLVDAFACGTPVITSRRTSLPEVAGEAAEFADAESVPSIARALHRLLEDGGRRAELRRLGEERLAHFSWSQAAAILEDVLLRAVERR